MQHTQRSEWGPEAAGSQASTSFSGTLGGTGLPFLQAAFSVTPMASRVSGTRILAVPADVWRQSPTLWMWLLAWAGGPGLPIRKGQTEGGSHGRVPASPHPRAPSCRS